MFAADREMRLEQPGQPFDGAASSSRPIEGGQPEQRRLGLIEGRLFARQQSQPVDDRGNQFAADILVETGCRSPRNCGSAAPGSARGAPPAQPPAR